MDPHLLAEIVTLLLIACAVAIAAEWFKQPYTIALVLVGLGVAVTKLTPHIYITHDVIFTLILPPLLFYGAMHMDLEELGRNWRTVAMLAIPGVIISTLVIGAVLHYVLHFSWTSAFLFGALISPTDPISVLSILKKVGAPKRLRLILEGESLFNDGTGVVIFTIVLGIFSGHEHFELGHTLAKFLKVAGGGTLIGLATGYVAYRILKRLDNHLLEVALTVVLTFGTPLLAEAFHLSGVIAIVVAGMIIGNYGKIYSMSPKTRETLDTFWEVIDFLINSILFIVIGVELQVISFGDVMGFSKAIAVTIAAVILSRLMVVYPVAFIKNRIRPGAVPLKWAHVLFWGSLKGSISIALVVGLPEGPQRRMFLILAFAMVLFSLVVQGLTIRPLIQRLGVQKKT